MKRRICFLLILTMIICLLSSAAVFAARDDATVSAETLHALGLFQGKGTNPDGTPIFDLGSAPTRMEAVTMLVRLLGKENEAKAGTWPIPFSDVADWAKPYIGYAYANGLTKGTGDTTFGGDSLVSATQYLTFVLRALGYDSSTDFRWDAAWELSDQLGITHGEYPASAAFTRGDVAIVSVNALTAVLKSTTKSLLDSLLEDGAVDASAAEAIHRRKNDVPAVDSKTVDVDFQADQDGKCFMFYEDLKSVFPAMEYFSYNGGINHEPKTIDEMIVQSGQMMSLIASGGEHGEQRGYGYFPHGIQSGILISLYSGATRLCAYFYGIPEQISESVSRIHFTVCDYDFSSLYQRQKDTFAPFENLPRMEPDQAREQGAEYFIHGWQLETEQPDEYMIRHQQYFLWIELNTEDSIWNEWSIDKLEESYTWANENSIWALYYFLNENKEPIGYTIHFFRD